jgi:hypothetical protein
VDPLSTVIDQIAATFDEPTWEADAGCSFRATHRPPPMSDFDQLP